MAERKPRVRFAPSPTGYLHIGGVRTALFNWLWARKTGGTFVLRIEDTDRERSTPENEQIILRDMRWFGMDWDEGPEVGGPHGPYRQMDRLDVYRELADKLVARGAAYRCYCTKEELDAQREALKAQNPKAIFRYPGTCRDRKGPAPDRPSVLRLRAPSSGAVTYRDLVFGEVTTPNSAQQDQVLVRSDGVPLYNFGAVVDDITMGITLVARGRDHMVNTPIQILLYEALGAELPAFAHLPMMLAPSGEKLSKRHGAVSVGEYRDRGIPPAGLLNYLVRFGWSYNDEEVFSIPDLTQKFDWERCGRGDGKFDAKKLAAIAFEHLKRDDLTSLDAYVDGVLPFLRARGLGDVDRAKVAAAVPSVRERAQTWLDAADALDFFFRDPPEYDEKAVKKFLTPDKAARLPVLRDVVASAPDFSAAALEAHVTAWLAREGLELKDVAQPARVATTGRSASPGLFEVFALLGRERSLARLDRGVALAAKAQA
jgi:glutamyl-tRNA synthetase